LVARTVWIQPPAVVLVFSVLAARERGVVPRGVQLQQPTLEDAFLALTDDTATTATPEVA
jgi:hypothetical protein